MMKKKLLAPLAALCCLSFLLPLSAQAVDIIESENGSMLAVTEDTLYSVIVQTDGTVLTEDMFSDFDGYLSMQTWSEFSSTCQQWEFTSDISGENVYVIDLFFPKFPKDQLVIAARRIMLEMDCVENTYIIDYKTYSWAYFFYEFMVTPLDVSAVPDADSIPELAEFTMSDGVYSENSYKWVLEDSDSSEFVSRMESENLPTAYSEYLYMEAYADMILEAHSDTLAAVEPVVYWETNSSDTTKATPTSVWLTAGDPNSDGAVDAADAADVLQTAADNGAAAADAQTPATPATDVNADGTVDAADAAAILQYAAAEGAGLETDWVEILK